MILSNIYDRNIPGRDQSAESINWDHIEHFTRSEFGSHIPELSASLIYALDSYREFLGSRVVISPATWGSHSSRSWHKAIQGRNKYVLAIDVFVEELSTAWILALGCGLFTGVGVYPNWTYRERGLKGGLHLDLRSTTPVFWWNLDGEYHYFGKWSDPQSLFSFFSL